MNVGSEEMLYSLASSWFVSLLILTKVTEPGRDSDAERVS